MCTVARCAGRVSRRNRTALRTLAALSVPDHHVLRSALPSRSSCCYSGPPLATPPPQAYWAQHVPKPIIISRPLLIKPADGLNPYPILDFSYLSGKLNITCLFGATGKVTFDGFELRRVQVRVNFGAFITNQQ